MVALTFKVTEEQARELRNNARAKHLTLSDYLRHSVLKPKAKKNIRRIVKKNAISGLPCDATPGAIFATEEEIKAALADFP